MPCQIVLWLLLLTGFQLWSQLHLGASLIAQDHNADSCRVNGRTLTMKLKQTEDLDFDIANVKPPMGISVFSLASVQISLTFSPIPPASKRSTRLFGRASPKFEDLLGQRHGHQVLWLDLETPYWQYLNDQVFGGYESTLDMPSSSPEPLLYGNDHPPESPGISICANPGPLYLPDYSFQSLETGDMSFASEPSKSSCRLQADVAFLADPSSFLKHEKDTPAASSPISIFESLKSKHRDPYRSTAKGTMSSPSTPNFRTPIPPHHHTTFYKPILSLTDTALRTLIHPHPTRLPAGIKSTQTDSAVDSQTARHNTKPISLSNLAPSIFTPDYARGVAERASLVPSIAKSLATFLKYRAGAASAAEAEAEAEADVEPSQGDGDEEQEAHEEVKELLRGHVWMTMTNGLRISHAQKARRLRPLVLPDQWGQGDRWEAIEQGETEMLDGAFLPVVSYHMGEEEVEEREEVEVAMLDDLEQEDCRRDQDDTEQELLFDDGQVDLSFLEEEFEELCLFERCAVDSDGVAVLEKRTVADDNDDQDEDDGVEEMLF